MILDKSKYTYKQYEREEHNGKRKYVIDSSTKIPSVTTIIEATMTEEKRNALFEWRKSIGDKAADKIMHTSASLGSTMHKNIEDYLIEKKKPIGSPITVMMTLSIINSLRFEVIYGCEVPLYHSNLYAGTADCVALEDGELSIIDFKNSVTMKSEEMIEDYFIQLAAYAMAHEYMFNDPCNRGCIKISSQDGKFAEYEKRGSEFDIFKTKWANRVKEYYESGKY